ncbi:MAG: hypothetical protein WCF03_02310 [Nitrososphaeraceae archaeon]
MEKKIHIAVTIVVLAFGLIFATVGSVGSGHAQKNATSGASKAVKLLAAGGAKNKTAGNMTSAGGAATKSAGGAMNKTAGNMTSAGGAAANKTGGNASSSNPVSKIPVIGPGLNKLFGGK